MKNERRKAAQERQEARAARTPAEQWAELDKRLGENLGARKERARLALEGVDDWIAKATR